MGVGGSWYGGINSGVLVSIFECYYWNCLVEYYCGCSCNVFVCL